MRLTSPENPHFVPKVKRVLSSTTMTPARSYALFLALLSALVAGCVREPESLPTTRPKWIRWAVRPERQSDETQRALLVREGLTRAEIVDGEARTLPALASSWAESPPGTLVLRLRPDMRWSDGEPFEARQVIASWRKLIARCRAIPAAALLFPISHAREICAGTAPAESLAVSAPDRATLAVTLSRPTPLFPLALAHPALFPMRDGSPASLGPFVALPPARPDETRYARNPRYHGPGPGLEGIVLKAMSSAPSRVQAFLDNGVDVADDLPDVLVGYPAGATPVTMEPTSHVVAMVLNTARKPFHLAAVRALIRQAIQRDELLKLTRLPHLAAAGVLAFVPSLVTSRRASGTEPLPAAARASLEALKSDPAPKRVTLGWWGPLDAGEIALNVQAQLLKNLELKVDIVGDVAPRAAGRPPTQATMTLVSWVSDPIAPWRHLEWLTSAAGESITHWKSAELEATLSRASTAETTDALYAALKEADTLLTESETVVIPLFQKRRTILRSDRVRDVRRSPFGGWDFSEAGLDVF